MAGDSTDINGLILDQLRKINEEVRRMPKLEAQTEAMRDATQQLECAMRETTAGLRMQAEAHSKLIGELQLDVHRSIAAVTMISNDMHGLMSRVKDLEGQVRASFMQQQALARDVREVGDRESVPALTKHLDDYQMIKNTVETLEKGVQDLLEKLEEFLEFLPWLRGLRWFLRILFYALATAAVAGLLWLFGNALLGML